VSWCWWASGSAHTMLDAATYVSLFVNDIVRRDSDFLVHGNLRSRLG
jgi:hypothetical protein